MPNSTTSSSRPSSKFLDRTLLGAKDGIPQPEWVFHYFIDWKVSDLASEQIIQAKIEELKGRRSGELPEVQQETSSSLPSEE